MISPYLPFLAAFARPTPVRVSERTPNEQMYLRLGELPLYLSRSRSASDGGFKRMKEGYFKTQAVSTLVEEVRNGFTTVEIFCRGHFDKTMLKWF